MHGAAGLRSLTHAREVVRQEERQAAAAHADAQRTQAVCLAIGTAAIAAAAMCGLVRLQQPLQSQQGCHH